MTPAAASDEHSSYKNLSVEAVLSKIKERPVSFKILASSTTGWIVGISVTRIGKLIALSLGSGIILMQVSHEKGFVKLNWCQLDRSIKNVPAGFNGGVMKKWRRKLTALVEYDRVLFYGFVGGFLMGISAS